MLAAIESMRAGLINSSNSKINEVHHYRITFVPLWNLLLSPKLWHAFHLQCSVRISTPRSRKNAHHHSCHWVTTSQLYGSIHASGYMFHFFHHFTGMSDCNCQERKEFYANIFFQICRHDTTVWIKMNEQYHSMIVIVNSWCWRKCYKQSTQLHAALRMCV